MIHVADSELHVMSLTKQEWKLVCKGIQSNKDSMVENTCSNANVSVTWDSEQVTMKGVQWVRTGLVNWVKGEFKTL